MRGEIGPARRWRSVVSYVALLIALIALWEGYKAMGQATGGVWPLTDVDLPVRTNDRSMPHVWDIVGVLFTEAQRGRETLLLTVLLEASWFTFRSALIGFVGGSLFGVGLAMVFVRSPLAERGLTPFMVASQTVPVLLIAPLLVIWGRRNDLPIWLPVGAISAYLAFYPVAVNMLKGLRSPESTTSELMRSYAASPRQVLWKLQMPAALPFLFPALKVAATASVIGAVVGELPAGIQDGLGRAILSFASSFSSAPEKLFASILVASLLGLVFVCLVTLAERLAVPSGNRIEYDASIASAQGQGVM
jgi:NitT/TauT family transport system permease protein